MRVGIGYDIHRLVSGRKLFLGGVEVPYEKGLLGHSDADVVIHAIADAMLGALALGDIGRHFPNTDMRYKDIRSTELLGYVVKIISEKGYVVNNVDTMIIAEAPKIGDINRMMIDVLSKILNVAHDRVSIKATTNEGIGPLGKGEAIAAYAVVTLNEKT